MLLSDIQDPALIEMFEVHRKVIHHAIVNVSFRFEGPFNEYLIQVLGEVAQQFDGIIPEFHVDGDVVQVLAKVPFIEALVQQDAVTSAWVTIA